MSFRQWSHPWTGDYHIFNQVHRCFVKVCSCWVAWSNRSLIERSYTKWQRKTIECGNIRFMTKGEDRKKCRFVKWQLCGVWKLPFCDHSAIKLTQNRVCFTNPRIKLLVLPSVTRECHPKVLELLDLLQCIAAYLQRTLPWVSGKTYASFCCSDFHPAWQHTDNLKYFTWKPTPVSYHQCVT